MNAYLFHQNVLLSANSVRLGLAWYLGELKK